MKKEKKIRNDCPSDCASGRAGRVGGQAVLEGVMMKAGSNTVTTCRKEDGTLVVYDDSFTSVRTKHKILDLPIIRGVVNFVEMMMLSFRTLSNSADALGIEEEESKFEKWLNKHLGIGITTVIMVIAMILGVVLALGLFMFLPNLIATLIDDLIFGGALDLWTAIIEGAVKVLIFIGYLWLVSLIPDIKRTFMYHGAEHKSIACFENMDELTPENARKHKRFHPRCGTSFMFFMILLGIIAGLAIKIIFERTGFLSNTSSIVYTVVYSGIRLLILPIIMGLGYEFIKFAGKHDNFFTRTLSAPGLWVQRITTKEPTDDMLEVAIISLKCALRNEYPEFMEFYKARSWEPKVEEESASAEADVEDASETGEVAEAVTASDIRETDEAN